MNKPEKHTVELRRYFLLEQLRDKGFRGIVARHAYRNFIETELNALLGKLGIAAISNQLEA